MSAEREIIQSLRESRRDSLMSKLHESQAIKDSERLDEARRSQSDLFFDQLDGTLNRIVTLNKRYNTAEQQEFVYNNVIYPMLKLQDSRNKISELLETPASQSVFFDLDSVKFTGTYEDHILKGTQPSTEVNLKHFEMLERELLELYDRAKAVGRKYVDKEQNLEYSLYVLQPVEVLVKGLPFILKVFKDTSGKIDSASSRSMSQVQSKVFADYTPMRKDLEALIKSTNDNKVTYGFTQYEIDDIKSRLDRLKFSQLVKRAEMHGNEIEVEYRDDRVVDWEGEIQYPWSSYDGSGGELWDYLDEVLGDYKGRLQVFAGGEEKAYLVVGVRLLGK